MGVQRRESKEIPSSSKVRNLQIQVAMEHIKDR